MQGRSTLLAALALAACTSAARQQPAGAAAGLPSAAAAAPVVIVVRHAEKAAVPGDDPPLSEAGTARARDLATALGDAGVGTILVTQWQRTALTAAPLAASTGVRPTVVATGANVAEHAAAVARAARAAGGTVLVVGHSNTVGPIVAALGGPAGVSVCDAQYGTLHTVLPAAGGPARLVRASYGAPDPAVGAGCAVMAPAR